MFVAVQVPERVRDQLSAQLGSWRRDLDGWRWSDPARWHLTLAFLGDVDASLLPDLTRRLARVSTRHQPFEVALGGVGAFSRAARARVLWIGVARGREPLTKLAGSVGASARRSKIPVEDRRYRPHLTLARRKAPVDVRERLTVDAGLETSVWPVESFVLVESHVGAEVRHDPVEEFQLAGRSSPRPRP
jgi:RNA 2',3'-cyclic 3'-phosphodiesterase